MKNCFYLQDQATKDKVLQSMANMSSAQIVSAGLIPNSAQLSLTQGLRTPYQKQQGVRNCFLNSLLISTLVSLPCL